jgi:hypothetical protein
MPTHIGFDTRFASDMIRVGVSLPALLQLMGHSQIQTTLVYVQLTPLDVYQQYACCKATRSADSTAASLSPDTVRGYRAARRSFLRYLGADHREICSLKQLHRDPHPSF